MSELKKKFFYVFYRANDTVEPDGTVSTLVTELVSNWKLLFRCESGAGMNIDKADEILTSHGDNLVIGEKSTISFNILPVGGDSGTLEDFAGVSGQDVTYGADARFTALESAFKDTSVDILLFNGDPTNPYCAVYYNIRGAVVPNFVAGEVARLNIEISEEDGQFKETDIDVMLFTIDTPAFLPSSGSFATSVDVSISCKVEGVSVYYTTDGTDPDTTDTLYTGAITLTDTTTVTAIAYASGYTDSAVASKTYTAI